MVIYKYSITHKSVQTIELPIHSQILCVQLQFGKPFIWVRIPNPEAPTIERTFEFSGTGEEIDNTIRQYIGTWQEGPFVWHLFEKAYL